MASKTRSRSSSGAVAAGGCCGWPSRAPRPDESRLSSAGQDGGRRDLAHARGQSPGQVEPRGERRLARDVDACRQGARARRRQSARRTSSAISVDLPIPASPTSTTTCPCPSAASRHRSVSQAISWARPKTVTGPPPRHPRAPVRARPGSPARVVRRPPRATARRTRAPSPPPTPVRRPGASRSTRVRWASSSSGRSSQRRRVHRSAVGVVTVLLGALRKRGQGRRPSVVELGAGPQHPLVVQAGQQHVETLLGRRVPGVDLGSDQRHRGPARGEDVGVLAPRRADCPEGGAQVGSGALRRDVRPERGGHDRARVAPRVQRQPGDQGARPLAGREPSGVSSSSAAIGPQSRKRSTSLSVVRRPRPVDAALTVARRAPSSLIDVSHTPPEKEQP